MRISRLILVVMAAVAAVGTITGCGGGKTTTDASPTGTTTDKPIAIAFFGAAKANSFAQAAFKGIEEYAAAHNATAT